MFTPFLDDYIKIWCLLNPLQIRSDIYTEDGMLLQQIRLPFTPDSVFLAAIIGSINNGIANIHIKTVQDLRSMVAQILNAIFIQPESFSTIIESFFADRDRKISAEILSRLLSKKLENAYPGYVKSDFEELIASIEHGAHGNAAILLILSGIYGCTFRVFDFDGDFIMDISTREIFVPLVYPEKYISISAKIKYDGSRREIAFNVCNALVANNTWDYMLGNIQSIPVKSSVEFLLNQLSSYEDRHVMYGCTVDGFDQIMIGGDDCSLFEAAYVGAKQAGAITVYAYEDSPALKRAVQNELRILAESAFININTAESNELVASLWDAIAVHNNDHNTNYKSISEYIESITEGYFWASNIELGLIANLLQIQIYVHTLELKEPIVHSSNNQHPEVHLYRFCDHYNLLVPHNTWIKQEKVAMPTSSKRQRGSKLLV